jgi:hypothetical protein
MWWMVATALAGTVLSPDASPVLGAPSWLAAPDAEAASGWEAPILDDQPGRVRVWVHADVDAAKKQFASAKEGLFPRQVPLGADDSAGDPGVHVVFRQGELVVEVQRPAGAAVDLGERLLKAVRDGGAWPGEPSVRVVDGLLSVAGTWSEQSVTLAPRLDRTTFRSAPTPVVRNAEGRVVVPAGTRWVEVRVWDRYGRSSKTRWE